MIAHETGQFGRLLKILNSKAAADDLRDFILTHDFKH